MEKLYGSVSHPRMSLEGEVRIQRAHFSLEFVDRIYWHDRSGEPMLVLYDRLFADYNQMGHLMSQTGPACRNAR